MVGYCIAKANEHVPYMCIFFVYLGVVRATPLLLGYENNGNS